jgi:ferric-dicitrate binding protein FerR (iron transport regulator)
MSEISDLALRASEDRLSMAQQERLNQLLESSDEACRALLLCGILDAELTVHARVEAAQDRALEAITAEFQPTEIRAERSRPRELRLGWWAAVAASLLIAALIAFTPKHRVSGSSLATRAPQPVGSLTSAPGAKFSGKAPRIGEPFTEGDMIVLDEGEAHVSMACGAEFVVKAPAELRFDTSKHVELHRGVLTAHVAAWGSGFTVDTSAMRVVDLGTEFAISASDDDVETHVLRGQVRVQPLATSLSGRRSVLLTQGEGLRVDSGAETPVRIAAQKDRFPGLSEKFRPFKPIALWNTGIGLTEGDEDPHWRIIGGPKCVNFNKPQFAVVCKPDERYSDNEPQSSQWLSFARDVRPGGKAKSIYTFETKFDLAGFDPLTVMVAAQMLADNGVRAVRINGQEVPIVPWDDNTPGQTFKSDHFRLIEIRDGFVPGVNKLQIDVWNGIITGAANDPNPMSLRVEFQAFGRLENQHEATNSH